MKIAVDAMGERSRNKNTSPMKKHYDYSYR